MCFHDVAFLSSGASLCMTFHTVNGRLNPLDMEISYGL